MKCLDLNKPSLLGIVLGSLVLTVACGDERGDGDDAIGETEATMGGSSFTQGSTSDQDGSSTASSTSFGSSSDTLGTSSSSSSSGSETGDVPCSNLAVTIRDFSDQHPDFEVFSGSDAFEGIVEDQLGGDGKPVYAHAGPTEQTSGPEAFAQWYNDTPNINVAVPLEITLTETTPGVFTYASDEFFPVDDQGFGNEGREHNFHFTTEIHTVFTYGGGEVFTFTGDDDLWLFVNGRLGIDLGGLHPEVTDTLDLDDAAEDLGIEPGGTYTLDVFHAERHTTQSNFRIDTTIDCFEPPE